MKSGERKKSSSSLYWVYCCGTNGFQQARSPQMEPPEKTHQNAAADSEVVSATGKKPGGWRAMPYILGNETFERLATFGLLANFMVYLMKVFHMEQVSAANLINIWSGITNFAPLFGAFISDAYVGRFKTIAFASCSAFLGMVILTLTAWLPHLHPPKCHPLNQSLSPQQSQCEASTTTQLGILFMGLSFISIGAGGIRPCSIPFGVDQFDPTTQQGIKGINSFFNWYYATFTVVILISMTLVVYIQDSVSWVVGFGIPTILMFFSIILFFIGTRIYVHVKPEGSVFSGIVQVFVAASKKRHLKLPEAEVHEGGVIDHGIFYDPPVVKETVLLSKLPLTNQFRFLNKAAMLQENDLNPDGSPKNQWRLCTIQQVEEVKCIIRVIPISLSSIISLTAITQQGTFTVSQALIMDRHLGPKFQIPAASITVVSMITIGLWIPVYDRILVPSLRKITKHEGGITLLQRIGIGIVFSILSMVVAGLVEKDRRSRAISHPNVAPMSVMWLAPQLSLMGFCEAFNIIGQIEFYNKEFPDHMRSLANSLLSCTFALSSYLSSLVIMLVHRFTQTRHHQDWLTNDLNAGRLDYFYYVLAGMGVLNLGYFIVCAQRYRYKHGGTSMLWEEKSYNDVELRSSKIPS